MIRIDNGPLAKAAVTFKEVTVTSSGVSILDRVNASVPRGSWTAVIGPNGAGKSTLLLALLGMIPYHGLISIAPGEKAPRIGYVPQRFSFDRGMPITVMEFMLMGRQRLPFWFGCRRGMAKARELLGAVRAEALEGRRLGALSGGEMQRVLLALALQEEPDLLVLDEPTAGVDMQGEQIFCELLDELRREKGFTQIMVSHDLATVTHHATHVICLNRRVAAEGPPRQVLTGETLTAIFGLHMGLVDAHGMPEGDTSCTAACCRKKFHV
ncbi:MAG: metal ABC transporter ATP-binding protein [Deltaproteobacteria bacterium]|nr:metal ABC transporter ATP-binding protein [Deltaproteobacteria bacterium]